MFSLLVLTGECLFIPSFFVKFAQWRMKPVRKRLSGAHLKQCTARYVMCRSDCKAMRDMPALEAELRTTVNELYMQLHSALATPAQVPTSLRRLLVYVV
jgi:hypothetical protein